MLLFGKAFLFLFVFTLYGCSSAPLQNRTANLSLPYDEISQSSLYKSVETLSEQHNQLSGFYPLDEALEAFLSRVLLARAAQKTLDIQYYIWRQDNTGTLLLYELLLAADRGVRVRLLLDDLGSYGLDEWLALLNQHPNIEVRLFNPFSSRKTRVFGFITNFNRANRRMHNKSFTADQAITIVGGRNIGDEYFAATDGVLFSDLDVMAVGQIASKVSQDFDLYWMSQSAYPVEQLFSSKQDKDAVLQQVSEVFRDSDALRYVMALKNSYDSSKFKAEKLPLEWAKIRLVSDNPIKGLGLDKDSDLLLSHLDNLLDEKIEQLDLVSPYFVPAKVGTENFVQLAAEGAKVRILTNAQEATDVTAVHSGYIKRRKDLLRAGIEIYEMKNQLGGVAEETKSGSLGSGIFGSAAGSSLHAKTFAINNKQLFVGSFNFDPRSARLNTELGLLIDSPTLASKLNWVFTNRIATATYQVKLDAKDKLVWEERTPDNQLVLYNKEPGTTWMNRFSVRLLSLLPIDWLL